MSGKSGDSVSVVVEQNGIEKVLKGSHVLVATGRKPNTEGLGLELAGVELTERGYIKVDERLQTTVPGVWAIGEVAGSPQFTHISLDDFRVVHANLTGGTRVTTGRQVPYCLFTDPELARIGPTEAEARARGTAYRLFKVPMDTNLRARALSETRGFVKALVEADGERILGFTAFGTGAGETLAAVQVAMIAGLPHTALRDAVLTHPTLVEGLIASVLIRGVEAQLAASLEELDGALVLLGRSACRERAEILTALRARVELARIQPVLTARKFSNHGMSKPDPGSRRNRRNRGTQVGTR